MTNENTELLRALSLTAHTGLNAMRSVLPEVKNPRMRRQLKHQIGAYESFAQQSGISRPGSMASKMAKMSIRAQARMNPSPSHIASMMMQGSEMGIIKMQKALNHNPHASQDAKTLAKNMIRFEENTINAYRPFL